MSTENRIIIIDPAKALTTEELEDLAEKGILTHSHTSWCRGYISRRKPEGYCVPYFGKFGRGYVVHRPTWLSTQYHYIAYFLFT